MLYCFIPNGVVSLTSFQDTEVINLKRSIKHQGIKRGTIFP